MRTYDPILLLYLTVAIMLGIMFIMFLIRVFLKIENKELRDYVYFSILLIITTVFVSAMVYNLITYEPIY
jgi:heme O synthase-like polyprenyltransferase